MLAEERQQGGAQAGKQGVLLQRRAGKKTLRIKTSCCLTELNCSHWGQYTAMQKESGAPACSAQAMGQKQGRSGTA